MDLARIVNKKNSHYFHILDEMLGLGAPFHLRVPPYHVYQEKWFFLLQNDHSEKHILYPSVPKKNPIGSIRWMLKSTGPVKYKLGNASCIST
ncbi:MAG: hypothetical protein CM1200mP10_15120 [Candidatus Neomarinimicrobiota bacterium]|nr:MAG: hypothetical protein CM1200mP10_15120 [Candidatus Neomarinimicrobiota bacterium]